MEFTKLNLRQAYLQLELDEESRSIQLSTLTRVFLYTIAFHSASHQIQVYSSARLKCTFKEFPSCCKDWRYFRDRQDKDCHLEYLKEVLARLEKVGVRLKLKCLFSQTRVIYLGHRINKEGIQPTESEETATQEAPPPRNVREHQAFLGMLNYYVCYVPNFVDYIGSFTCTASQGLQVDVRDRQLEA